MARDQIEVDLLLNAKKAEATIKQMNRELGKMGKTMGQAFSGTGGGASNNVRALGTGLSKATVRADEFSKSLEASNARVIAFGASAGLIMNVDRALRAMVKTTIQVEKAMADVNVVMNVSNKQLEQFGKGMFKVAKETAQGFSTVAEASTELARQGLGMEKTLARTKDALILTRLTGMNAADAVKSLTAAVNSFSKEGATSAQVVNRMAKVDAQFAVSSEDLAKSISRVGASAQSAGVSMNELMAITTAVQQRTARGGAVIGNAFKTIFTRIQRSDVQQKLENLGVATRSMSGEILSGIQVLQNLAKNFDSLSKAQQSSTAESVAGVFQVNILKSALADLSQQNSAYAGALRAANTATDEAYRKNEKLNETLDSLVNKTMANLVQAGSALGGNIFGPAISNVLNTVNATIEAFSEGGKFESFGEGIGKNLVKGIGKFIGGPGLIIATSVFAKLTLSLSKFATTAFKDIMGINTAVKQRAALEEIVVNTLASEPALLQKVKMGTLSVLDVEKQILATIKQQQVERAALKGYGGAVAGSLYQRGTRVGSSGRAFSKGMGRMGRASGFVPNFADANSERAAAAAGGYTAGAIKTMSQPGAGTMMYNSAETVKQFPGMSQKAIMPPSNSSAGANYRSTFGAAHGFDPYAANGFVPNFAARGLRNVGYGSNPAMFKNQKGASQSLTKKGMAGAIKRGGMLNVMGGGIAMLVPRGSEARAMSEPVKGEAPYGNFKASFPILSYKPSLMNRTNGPIDVKDEMELAAAQVTKKFAMSINPPARTIEDHEVIQALSTTRGSKGAMSAAAGAAFEVGMDLALDKKAASKKPRFGDFDVRPPYAERARDKAFGGSFSLADFKISSGYSARSSMTAKIAKEALTNGPGRRFIKHTPLTGKASGFVPNFSPLISAVGREMAAGVPASAIRVGSSPALRSAGNPGGVGVYNTKDEPAGLTQGINRSRSAGINPKSHGVPNFALGGMLGGAGKGLAGGAGKAFVGMELLSLMGGSDNPITNILSSAGLGFLSGGPKFALLMAGITAVSEGLDYMGSSSEKSSEALKKQNQAQNESINKSIELTKSFADLAEGMGATEFTVKKATMLRDLGVTKGELPATNPMAGTPELKALMDAGPKEFKSAEENYSKRLEAKRSLGKVSSNTGGMEALIGASLKASSEIAREELSKRQGIGGDQNKLSRSLFGVDSANAAMMLRVGKLDNTTAKAQVYSDYLDESDKINRHISSPDLKSGTGSLAGEDFLKRLSGIEGMSPDVVISRLASQKINPASLVEGGDEGFKGGARSLAKILGINQQDLLDNLRGDGSFFDETKENVRSGGMSVEMRQQELTKYINTIIAGYIDQETYNEKLKEATGIEDDLNKDKKTYSETLIEAMRSQETYRQSVDEAKRALDTMRRDSAHGKAMFGLGSNLAMAQANARLGSVGVAEETKRQADRAAELNKTEAKKIAEKALSVDVMEGLKGMNAVKFIEGGGFSGENAKKALGSFSSLRDSIKSSADQGQIDSLITELGNLKGLKLDKAVLSGDAVGIDTQAKLDQLDKIINTLSSSQKKI